MFERYTVNARRGIFFAAHESLQRNGGVLSVEHLLLGLVRESSSTLEEVMHLKSHEDALRAHLQMPPWGDLPLKKISPNTTQLDDNSKLAIVYAGEEAELDGVFWIDCDHLLRALLRFPNCGGEALSTIGITLDGFRLSLADHRRRFPPPPPPKWLWLRDSITRRPYLWHWSIVMGLMIVLALAIVALLKLRGPI
jgi:hypothetical protein